MLSAAALLVVATMFALPASVRRPSMRPSAAHAVATAASTRWPGCSRPNIILVILESASPAYFSAYRAAEDTTPNLVRLQQHGVTFDRCFAQSPVSSHTLFTMISGLYPGSQCGMETARCPRIDSPTLPDVFNRAGYRTTFLHSGQLSYESNKKFVASSGFERVFDFEELATRHPTVRVTVPYDDWRYEVVDDRVLATETLRLIDDAAGQPFLIGCYTYMTHWPYYPTRDPATFFGDGGTGIGSRSAYVNALHNADAMIGDLVRGLEKRGLTDSTVLVITGDHGEAFGEHGFWGHGECLYDEVLHVPMIISNPRLFSGPTRSHELAQHLDLAPTLAELAGLDAPAEWQGTSLFAPNRPAQTFHVIRPRDTDCVILALHEGHFKYIYAPDYRCEQLFDLAIDPGERTNLAEIAEHAVMVRRSRAAVCEWAESQSAILQRVWDRSRER